jgi:hypothetical protein
MRTRRRRKVMHRFDKYDLEAPTIFQTEKSYYAQ